uniref:Uncharacterized protein n=1 Tax=Nelumbo nucifera TaxID=4432 RepID=A0A822ZQV2_NELNU|nr:TPA_asm: hypothetical protein HUJ06_017204 [Nelumbo nucifera]
MDSGSSTGVKASPVNHSVYNVRKSIRAALKVLFLVVFLGWLMLWIMLPTKTYKNKWTPKLSTNLLLFTFPIMFIAAFGCVYLHLGKKSDHNYYHDRKPAGASSRLAYWKRPVLVQSSLGIVTAMELAFSAMFIALMIWSLANYLNVSFQHLYADKKGVTT